MKPEQSYHAEKSCDPIRALRPCIRKLTARRGSWGERAVKERYFVSLLVEHLQEYYPCEMMPLEDIQGRARIAYKESVRTDIPISDALSNALRYLFFSFETSGFERLKSEIWMQGYYMQEKDRNLNLPEGLLEIFAKELSLQCRVFLDEYRYTQNREALVERCGIREIVKSYLARRWNV